MILTGGILDGSSGICLRRVHLIVRHNDQVQRFRVRRVVPWGQHCFDSQKAHASSRTDTYRPSPSRVWGLESMSMSAFDMRQRGPTILRNGLRTNQSLQINVFCGSLSTCYKINTSLNDFWRITSIPRARIIAAIMTCRKASASAMI